MGFSLTSPASTPSLASLASLAEHIARIEGRGAAVARIAPADPATCVPTGWPGVDAALGGGIPRRGLHEWWGSAPDVGAVLTHLAWQAIVHDDLHRPGAARRVLWIGRSAWPDAYALVRGLRAPVAGMFGARMPRVWPDARLHARSLLVDPAQVRGGAVVGARLWAIEQAARCPGVCAVVADGTGFDMAATRRLQLAAHDVLLMVACTPQRRAAPSACTTRWRVERVDGHAREEIAARAGIDGSAGINGSAGVAGSAGVDGLAGFHARLPAEPQWCITLERAKVVGTVTTLAGAADGMLRARAWRHWELAGTAQPPRAALQAAARRASMRTARMAARAAARLSSVRAAEDAEVHVLERVQVNAMERAPVHGHASAHAPEHASALASAHAPAQALARAPADTSPHAPMSTRAHPRSRSRSRCTSGGERWAAHQDDHAA